mmetsp:Transcript_97697/g.223965  ORF Transcript_97697/g.223965 Transcript_97697/m.223965 type:complete len:142 (+) Transcript_97697:815-1240(+)
MAAVSWWHAGRVLEPQQGFPPFHHAKGTEMLIRMVAKDSKRQAKGGDPKVNPCKSTHKAMILSMRQNPMTFQKDSRVQVFNYRQALAKNSQSWETPKSVPARQLLEHWRLFMETKQYKYPATKLEDRGAGTEVQFYAKRRS